MTFHFVQQCLGVTLVGLTEASSPTLLHLGGGQGKVGRMVKGGKILIMSFQQKQQQPKDAHNFILF